MLYPVLQSQVTLCAASCVVCMQSYLSHKAPLIPKSFFSSPNYKWLFLDESWTEVDAYMTQLIWELLDQIHTVHTVTPVRKWKSVQEEINLSKRLLLKGCKCLHFVGGRSSIAKNRNWQLNSKTQPMVHVRNISQIHNQSTVLVCWDSNTQWCFHLTLMWSLRTFFCGEVKMI